PKAQTHDAENDKFRDPNPRGGKIDFVEECKSVRGHWKRQFSSGWTVIPVTYFTGARVFGSNLCVRARSFGSAPHIPYTRQETACAGRAASGPMIPALAPAPPPAAFPGPAPATGPACRAAVLDGAFGARLLTGWSEPGTRPQFIS